MILFSLIIAFIFFSHEELLQLNGLYAEMWRLQNDRTPNFAKQNKNEVDNGETEQQDNPWFFVNGGN